MFKKYDSKQDFFNDIKYPLGYGLFKKTTHLINNLQAPNVEVHSLYGVDLKTPAGFVYKKASDWPDAQPAVVNIHESFFEIFR